MAFVYDGILVGLTRTRIMLVAMALAAAVFFLDMGAVENIAGQPRAVAGFRFISSCKGLAECGLCCVQVRGTPPPG